MMIFIYRSVALALFNLFTVFFAFIVADQFVVLVPRKGYTQRIATLMIAFLLILLMIGSAGFRVLIWQ